ncbi:MAG: hypothetical protein JO185_20565 [Acidobacteriaceae bacterium]|nr:hypothetical protein [Acidobacteriaceae bacterium]
MVTRFLLPEPSASQSGPVKAWCAPVVTPTYEPALPDKNPSFVERNCVDSQGGVIRRSWTLPFNSWAAIPTRTPISCWLVVTSQQNGGTGRLLCHIAPDEAALC